MIDITYQTLIQRLTTIAGAHINVASSDAGVLETLNYGEISYPLVFFVCDTTEIRPNEMYYNMIMLVCDIVDDRLLQQTTIQSKMLEVTKDIISYLINGDFDHPWTIDETSMIITPFVDNLPDLTAGWQTNFTIKVDYNNNGCDLPFNIIP
jgi:hypothetical protein